MGDLLHMFGVIEGSGGDNDERACMLYESKKKRKRSEARGSGEAIWRPDGGAERAYERCVITSMQTHYKDPGDVT